MRNQLDKLPVDGDSEATGKTDLENAYTLIYSIWQHIEENVKWLEPKQPVSNATEYSTY